VNFRRLAYSVVFGALAGSVNLDASPAQDSSQLKVLIAGIKHGSKSITAQFIASNDSKARIYIRNTSYGNTEDASLDSGEQLRYPKVSGIEECRHDLNNCVGQNSTNLNEYSYIEPGKFIPFTVTYQTQNPVNDNDTVSLSVSLIARFSSPNSDPSQAGAAKLLKFSFPSKHFN
jgi:hypothetical protein